MLHKLISFLTGNTTRPSTNINSIFTQNPEQIRQRREHALIDREAQAAKHVLGDIPPTHQRQFFCLDSHTWVWHEQWLDENRQSQSFMVQYEVVPNGILKRINGGSRSRVSGPELDNFARAVRAYYDEVATKVYGYQSAMA